MCPVDDDLDEDLVKHLDDGGGSDDEPYFEGAGEDEEPSAEVIAAAAEVRAEVAAPRKGGRPRKPRSAHVAGEPIAPQAAASETRGPVTRNLQEVWNDIIERVRDRGLGGPDAVTISVTRLTVGPNREAPVNLNAIPGQMVGGTPTMTPGEDLEDYVTRAYHVPSGAGPALYRFRFTLRNATKNDRHLGTAEIMLQSAADIRRQWEAAAQIQRERERDRDFGPVVGRGSAPRGFSAIEPQMPTAADHPTVAPPGPTAIPPSSDPTMMFMKYLMDQNAAERREAIRMGQQPPVLQLPPEMARMVGGAPQAIAPAAQAGDLESRVAKTVVDTLRAMGIVPQQQVAGVAVAQSAIQQPMLPSPGAAEVQKKVGDPLEGMERMFDFMERMDKMRDKFRDRFAPEEEEPVVAAIAVPTVLANPADDDENALRPVNETFVRFEGDPVMFGKKAEDETTFQWLVRLGTGNPKLVGKVLEKGAQLLDSGTLGKLITALVQQPGTAPRGLPNGGSLQPQAQHPQSNGAAGGWTPNVG